MKVLKDIAVAMDCHPKTAKRWIVKLRVPPDVIGHGLDKWHERSFARLMKLWTDYYNQAGTTPQIVRLKYAGDLFDARQATFSFLPCKPKTTILPTGRPLP